MGLPIIEKDEFTDGSSNEIIRKLRSYSLNNLKQQDNLIDELKKICRKHSKEKTGKKPITNINVIRI